jgi:UDP-3-O-[3-hydroxymyristoyl] glucosamine N-acyltransferase
VAISLGTIVESLGGALHGDSDLMVEGLAPLEVATSRQLSFLSNPKYQSQLASSKAACVIVSPQMRDIALARGACIVVEQPYLYFARVTKLWKKSLPRAQSAQIHPSAVIDPDAFVHPLARIGALVCG